jgi:hypothetical protein
MIERGCIKEASWWIVHTVRMLQHQHQVRARDRSMLIWALAANPACRFYEAQGGKPLRNRKREIGGTNLPEVGFGWHEL